MLVSDSGPRSFPAEHPGAMQHARRNSVQVVQCHGSNAQAFRRAAATHLVPCESEHREASGGKYTRGVDSGPKPLPAGRPGAKVGGIASRFAAPGSSCVAILRRAVPILKEFLRCDIILLKLLSFGERLQQRPPGESRKPSGHWPHLTFTVPVATMVPKGLSWCERRHCPPRPLGVTFYELTVSQTDCHPKGVSPFGGYSDIRPIGVEGDTDCQTRGLTVSTYSNPLFGRCLISYVPHMKRMFRLASGHRRRGSVSTPPRPHATK